ncbi:transcription factor SPT20 homolog [Zeugodacus cucurbitae]|uniref:transcription factor SPT20 homolog n=1 Tax=Zeugodacus cucurbitae TaxID=28588 RepID=UPI00059682D5|nr:transcription factor SPT20 homolog [Zeugodacus cucurbitae]
MFNQRTRVYLTQNINLEPNQAFHDIRECIVTEAFEYALCKSEIYRNENVVYQGLNLQVRALKDANGGVYNYCPCRCGLIFDTNSIPYREIATEYIPEPGQQVQEFDIQQHILDMQRHMAAAQQQNPVVPLEQLPHILPQIMEQQQQQHQQFMVQYQNLARQHYAGFMEQIMAPQGDVNQPQNVPINNIQVYVEQPQEYIEHPQEYAVNLQVPQPIQELEERYEIIEQQEVADEEDDDDESDEDDDMEVDDEDMEEEAEVEEVYIEEEPHVYIVPQPLPPPPPPVVEEPIQCYGISSTSSDDSDEDIWRGENPINYNRRDAVQYNRISSTAHTEGDESDYSDDEYDDDDWSTDSADELNDYY